MLRAHPRRSTNLTQGEEALVSALRAGDAVAAAAAVLNESAYPLTAVDIARAADLSADAAHDALDELSRDGKTVKVPSGSQSSGKQAEGNNDGAALFATKRMLQKMDAALENALLKFHAENPAATGISKESLRSSLAPTCAPAAFDALVAHAAEAGRIVRDGGQISHPQAGAGARKLEEQTAQRLLALLEQAGPTPPATKDLLAQVEATTQVGYKALGALERAGSVVKVSDEFCFAQSSIDALAKAVREKLAAGPASAADLKDAMGTSRKYAIPLLEYFDSIGLTRRTGDRRELAE